MSLSEKNCVSCRGGNVPAVTESQCESYLNELNGWQIENGRLVKAFSFRNFSEPMRLANQIALLSDRQNHHPDLIIKWGSLRVEILTHTINALSENDFILAAKIDGCIESKS